MRIVPTGFEKAVMVLSHSQNGMYHFEGIERTGIDTTIPQIDAFCL